jgi:hypothetical protein
MKQQRMAPAEVGIAHTGELMDLSHQHRISHPEKTEPQTFIIIIIIMELINIILQKPISLFKSEIKPQFFRRNAMCNRSSVVNQTMNTFLRSTLSIPAPIILLIYDQNERQIAHCSPFASVNQ